MATPFVSRSSSILHRSPWSAADRSPSALSDTEPCRTNSTSTRQGAFLLNCCGSCRISSCRSLQLAGTHLRFAVFQSHTHSHALSHTHSLVHHPNPTIDSLTTHSPACCRPHSSITHFSGGCVRNPLHHLLILHARVPAILHFPAATLSDLIGIRLPNRYPKRKPEARLGWPGKTTRCQDARGATSYGLKAT